MKTTKPIQRASIQAGFSLIEMMVALLFISILMAGMLRVYATTIASFASNQDALNTNREKRWAITRIQDDIQMGGYFFPLRTLPGYVSVNTATGQNALMILPDQTITVSAYDTATSTSTNETIRFDEVQFVSDTPIQVQAQLSAATTLPGSCSLTVLSGTLADVKVGDFMIVMDSGYESVKVLSISGTTVTLDTSATVEQDQSTGAATGVNAGFHNLTHQIGADVVFVRPLQVFRYTVLPMALDPANASATIPCLVRDQANYPSTGSRITWPVATANAAALTLAGVTRTVVAEGVAGQPTSVVSAPFPVTNYALRFDVSVDNGTTWERTGSGTSPVDWPAIATNLDTRLASVGIVPYKSVTSPTNPIWYRYIPVLFRFDLTARSSVQRQGINDTNSRSYRYRSQSLMISPRNFSLAN